MVQHIEYLLTRHDCVVVPGWGAWIVQSVSAVVAGNAAPLPPRRWLSFNASLSHNDGMLAHSLMRAKGCGYDEAMAQIAAVGPEAGKQPQVHCGSQYPAPLMVSMITGKLRPAGNKNVSFHMGPPLLAALNIYQNIIIFR